MKAKKVMKVRTPVVSRRTGTQVLPDRRTRRRRTRGQAERAAVAFEMRC